MRYHFLRSLVMTFLMMLLCCVCYVMLVRIIALWFPGRGMGIALYDAHHHLVGYRQIGQLFTSDRYFWGRPSAVNYDASQSGGTNLAPSNPELIQNVHERINYLISRNPGISANEIPVDWVTSSGSGLDPDISPAAACIQVKRVALARHLPEQVIDSIVQANVEPPLLHLLGPAHVNVLRLNLALDSYSAAAMHKP